MNKYGTELRALAALFHQLAGEGYHLGSHGRWQLRDTDRDAPFDIAPTALADKIADCTSASFMHSTGMVRAFEPDELELEIFDDLVTQARAVNHYDAFRLLGRGQTAVAVESVREDGRRDVLRFGYQTTKDEWRVDFPLMTKANYGTFARGGFLLEAMPPVLMLHQQGEAIEELMKSAFDDAPGYARDVIEKLLIGTPYMLTLFHDLAVLPDGTLINIDPENARVKPVKPMTAAQLRMKLMSNAADLNAELGGYFPSFLELYASNGMTKQELFFPTETPRTPRL